MCSTLFICKKVKVVDTDLCQLLHSQPAYSLMCCSDINQNMCTQTWLSRSYIYIYTQCIFPLNHALSKMKITAPSCCVTLKFFDRRGCHIKDCYLVALIWLKKVSFFWLPNLRVTWVWTKQHMISLMNLWTSCSATHTPLLFTFGEYMKPGYVNDFSYNDSIGFLWLFPPTSSFSPFHTWALVIFGVFALGLQYDAAKSGWGWTGTQCESIG